MNEIDDIALLKDKKSAHYWILITTVLYLTLLPILFGFSLISFMIFDNPDMSNAFGLIFIMLALSIPLSIPISIYFMWRRYFQKQYQQARLFCGLPILTTLIAVFLINVIEF